MKLVAFEIKNILGVQELSHTINGNVVEVSGGNGQGKTSTLEAVKDALNASSISNLTRNGEEAGEVVLDFGDMRLTRKHKHGSAAKTQVKARVAGSENFGAITSPAKFVKGLVDTNSVDPARLLMAKPKELVDVVLTSMPIQADSNRIHHITGKNFDVSGHALNAIAAIGKTVFEERTGVNREGKQLDATIKQLKSTLPENIPSEVEIKKDIERIQDENLNISESFNAERATVDAEIKERDHKLSEEQKCLQGKKQDFQNKDRDTEKAIGAEISALRDQILAKENEYSMFNQQTQNEINNIDKEIGALSSSRSGLEDERENKQMEIDKNIVLKQEENIKAIETANNLLNQAGIVSNTMNNIKYNEEELAKKKGLSASLGEQLKMLNEYKAELCKELPIKGLELREGNLFMDGVSFETLNTAERLKLVVKLAELNAGDCGVVVIDNSEMLDNETYNEFIKAASETDLIFMVGRVTNGDLTITDK